jgi:predicted nucleic acid-binding protein
VDDFKAANVLEFNTTEISLYQELVRQKIRVGTQDLRIAAIALTCDRTSNTISKTIALKAEIFTLAFAKHPA